ncbi:MAG: response regulator [Chloroflexi bacterium]|nr:response regulator [Chloroflexota bacterium]
MPGMNGDELAARVKKVSPKTPVFLLTGFGDILNASGEKPTNVDMVLGKPVTMAALREAVEKVTKRKLAPVAG